MTRLAVPLPAAIRAELEPSGERTIVVTERDDLLKEQTPARKTLGVVTRRAVFEPPRFVQAIRFESGDGLVEVGAEAIVQGRVAPEAAAELTRSGFAHRVDEEGRESEQWQRLLTADDCLSLAEVLADTAATLGLDHTNAVVEAF